MSFPKYFSVLVFLLVISLPLLSQQDSTLYKIKINQYDSWKRAGTVVAITGAAVTAAAAGLTIAGFAVDEDLYYYTGAGFMGLGVTPRQSGFVLTYRF